MKIMIFVIPLFIPHCGCPHDCLFCNQQEISGSRRDADIQVEKTIEEWLPRNKKSRPVQLAFFGGSFTCMETGVQEEFLGRVQPYIRKGLIHSLRCSTRPDCIDESVCHRLLQSGMTTVELGVQSLDEQVLQKARRGHTCQQSMDAIHLLQRYDFQVGVQLMLGLPGQSRMSVLDTVRRIIEAAPNFIRLYPVLVVKNSGLEKLYKNALYEPLSLEGAVLLAARCLELFREAGIEVIRMGLQPSDSLAQSILAGPYHPAFGELVNSRLWLQQIRRQLAGLEAGQRLQMRISVGDMSAIIGNKRKNILRLEQLGLCSRLDLVVDKERERGSVEYVVC